MGHMQTICIHEPYFFQGQQLTKKKKRRKSSKLVNIRAKSESIYWKTFLFINDNFYNLRSYWFCQEMEKKWKAAKEASKFYSWNIFSHKMVEDKVFSYIYVYFFFELIEARTERELWIYCAHGLWNIKWGKYLRTKV